MLLTYSGVDVGGVDAVVDDLDEPLKHLLVQQFTQAVSEGEET